MKPQEFDAQTAPERLADYEDEVYAPQLYPSEARELRVDVPLPRTPVDDAWTGRHEARKELKRATAPELGERHPGGSGRHKGTWTVEWVTGSFCGRRLYKQHRRGLRSREIAERWAEQMQRKYSWRHDVRIYEEGKTR